jgi:hypothetical protein
MPIIDIIKLKAPKPPKDLDDDKIRKALAKTEAGLAALAKALMSAKDEWQRASEAAQAANEATFKVTSDKKADPDKVKAAQEVQDAIQKIIMALDKL